MNIGKGLKFVRVAAGQRQGAMAKALGISPNYLSLLENNRAEPSIALLKRVSEVYDVPAGFLFWEDAQTDASSADSAVTDRVQRIKFLVHELQQIRLAKFRA